MESLSNEELARQYFDVATQHAVSSGSYRLQRGRIASLEINLYDYYREHRSLIDLKVEGIGKETKYVLQLILTAGVDKAKELI